MKSGFLARFPLEGEVWPALCVWTAWEGTHTLPSDGRTSAWPAAKEPDARPRALSGGSGRCASLYNGIISSQPRLQNLAMFPVLALQHKLSDFQLLSDTLTGTRSPSSEYTCLRPLLPWELQTWHAVIHCIFIPSRRTCKTVSHMRKGINSQNSLCNGGKSLEHLLLRECGNIFKVI